VAKIRDAQGSLDERIAELEEALEDAQSKLAALKRLSDRIQEVGRRAQLDEALDEEAIAA
jgi:prefoldin subunit 5